MDSNSHVEVNSELGPYPLDSFDHRYRHLHNCIRFLVGFSAVVFVEKAHYNVAVSDGVYFEERKPVALCVKLRKKVREHRYHLSRAIFIRKICEPYYVGIKQSHILVVVPHVLFCRVDRILNLYGYLKG